MTTARRNPLHGPVVFAYDGSDLAKLAIDDAIAAYTIGAAYAEFAEGEKGQLAPGMLADFVVLDRDITKVAPPEILKTRVLRTVVGGKTVYEAK